MHGSVWERSCIRSGKVRAGVAVNNKADHLDRIQRKTLRIIRSLATVSYKEKSKGHKKHGEETEVKMLTLNQNMKSCCKGEGNNGLQSMQGRIKRSELQSQPDRSRFDVCDELFITLTGGYVTTVSMGVAQLNA